MSDIVERLRDIENRWGTHSDRREAADEIERLRGLPDGLIRALDAEIERLREEARLMRATAVPRDEYDLLRDEIERLRAEVENLQSAIHARDAEIERLRAEIKRLHRGPLTSETTEKMKASQKLRRLREQVGESEA